MDAPTVRLRDQKASRLDSAWLIGTRTQIRVVLVLLMREALGKHGHDNLGFFWVIGEPLLLTVGIMVLWSMAHVSHGQEVEVIPFALTGYTFITLWRHIANKATRAFSGDVRILYHRQVALIDMLIARALLELLALFSAFIVAYVPLYLLGFCPPIVDPLALVGGFFFTAWFAFAFGLVLAGLSEFNEVLHHIIPPLMYITIPLTGAFTMEAWLPSNSRQILLWSPLVNCIEMIRSSMFSPGIETFWSANFLAVTCLVLTGFGVMLYSTASKKASE